MINYIVLKVVFISIIFFKIFSETFMAYLLGDRHIFKRIKNNGFTFFSVDNIFFLIFLFFINSPIILMFIKNHNIRYNNFKNSEKAMFIIGFTKLISNIFLIFISGYILKNTMNNTFIELLSKTMFSMSIAFLMYNFIPIYPWDTYDIIFSISDYELKKILNKLSIYRFYIIFFITIFFNSINLYQILYLFFYGILL